MSDILQILKDRRSCRKYKADLIPQESLDKILEAGTFAASGKGKQSALIVAVTNKEVRNTLSRLNAEVLGRPDFDPFYGAPEIIVVLGNKADSPSTYLQDGSLVLGNMMAEAESIGVGSCWINRAKEVFESAEGKALLKEWGISDDYEGIGNLSIGLPDAPKNSPAPRKADYIRYVK